MSLRPATVVALCALVLSAGACGGASNRASRSPATTTTVPGPTTTASPATTTGGAAVTTTVAPAPCPDAGTFARQAALRPSPIGGGLLTGVTVSSASACADDVTFTFRLTEPPGRPVVTTSYQDPPFRSGGSGETVPVVGNAFLVVHFEPAYTADLGSARATPTYTGPRRFTPTGARHAREIVLIDDFEGAVTWVVGLDAARPFESTYTDATTLRVRVS